MSKPLRTRSSPPELSSSISGTRPSVRHPEARKEARTLLLVEVGFVSDGSDPVWATSRDLALGGVFVQTITPAPFGAKVMILLRVPDHDDPICVDAVVRWTGQDGMGVQFGLMGARETHALMQLLAEVG